MKTLLLALCLVPLSFATAGEAVSDDYVIGPGDSLQINVLREPELSVTLPVRPDGKISTPLVEDMVAVGKSPTQLARDMEKVLATYVITPQVNVIVDNALSTFSQVQVVGEVRQPQAMAYREGLRVLDVVLVVQIEIRRGAARLGDVGEQALHEDEGVDQFSRQVAALDRAAGRGDGLVDEVVVGDAAGAGEGRAGVDGAQWRREENEVGAAGIGADGGSGSAIGVAGLCEDSGGRSQKCSERDRAGGDFAGVAQRVPPLRCLS